MENATLPGYCVREGTYVFMECLFQPRLSGNINMFQKLLWP